MHQVKKREQIDQKQTKNGLSKVQKLAEQKEKGKFENFNISKETIENLIKNEIQYLFPIQVATFDIIYSGKDLIARDRTGSGKTLAFALPSLEKFRNQNLFNQRGFRNPVVLVLVPTRELAMQVTGQYERFRNTPNEFEVLSVYGGTDIRKQIDQIRRGVDIIVGCPGRLKDLLQRGVLKLHNLKQFVLDETDQMLNFGFQEDIEEIIKVVSDQMQQEKKDIKDIQYLLFSATIPEWVDKIAYKIMKSDLERVNLVGKYENKTSRTVDHLYIQFLTKQQKVTAIGDIVKYYGGSHSRTIIFCDKQVEANEIHLKGQLKFSSEVLHGNIPQKQREVVFKGFREGKIKVMIATNVAARGLDIPKVDLIVQLSPPQEIDAYVHRSGRTGRAGKNGTCVTLVSKYEMPILAKIEQKAQIKLQKVGIPQIEDIIKANARDITKGFDKVSEEVLPYFKQNALDLIKQYSPEEALSRALALVSGYTQIIKQRSLLSSLEGYVTLQLKGDVYIRSLSYVWDKIRRCYSDSFVDYIKGMSFLADRKGVLFDIPDDHKDMFLQLGQDLESYGMKLTEIKDLPELEEKTRSGYNNRNSRGGYSRDNRGGYNRGGYGNRDSRGGYNRNGGDNRRNGSYNKYDRNGGSQQKQKNYQKLFVGNLPYDCDNNDIQDIISRKGYRPRDIYIVKDDQQKCKGFGYIDFGDEKVAQDAKRFLERETVKGRRLRIDFADQKF